MTNDLVPAGAQNSYSGGPLQQWEEPRALPALTRSPLERPVAAVRRYKWLMMGIILLSAGGGVAATRLVTAQYEVRASILITADSPMEARGGPIRSGGLLEADDWIQLMRSFNITDQVVRKLALFLSPANPGLDGDIFRGFGLDDPYRPGEYELVIDGAKKRWTLLTLPQGEVRDAGGIADSVGRKLGFAWRPEKWVFDAPGQRKVRFTVATPREAAVQLLDRLKTTREKSSNFLRMTLADPDPKLAAAILNTWVHEYVLVATALKRRKLSDFARTLEEQVQTAKADLDTAEVRLSSFRVHTITLPSEGTPIAAGLQETRDPVMKDFFDKRIEWENDKHDVALLEQLLGRVAHDSVPSDALLEIRSVAAGSAASTALRGAVADYHATENVLADKRNLFTDEHPDVKAALAKLTTLKKEKIPQLAGELLSGLRLHEHDDSVRVAAGGVNLQAIPQRTIEEERLRRIRDIASGLYTTLQNRYAEAQLAERSSSPDIGVLDSAIAPLSPTVNTAPRLVLISIVGGIGVALVLAILLDVLDGRLRYPEQAPDDLGLPVAGTVPRFPKKGVDQNSPEQMYQLVESFRSLRMSVINANNRGPVSVAISSPSPGEGKSLIAANLAMSFADAGFRTVLVDGDTRRGTLHDMFELPNSPGLTDFLTGTASLSDVVRPAAQANLHVVTSGGRTRRSPELLTSQRLPQLVSDLRSTYDVVIFDTPPLAAGVDGYSIATAAGGLLVVLRVGETARRMAAEKLRLFDRLPVNIVGAVLNGVRLQDGYGYYGYVPGYEAKDESEQVDVVEMT